MHKRMLDRRLCVFFKKQKLLKAKYGYVIHAVPGQSTHTHGLYESFGHPEIECTLPTDPNLLMHLVRDLAERVKGGQFFTSGEMVDDLIQNFSVKLAGCPTGLRLILPDPNGSLDVSTMLPDYAAQYKGTFPQ